MDPVALQNPTHPGQIHPALDRPVPVGPPPNSPPIRTIERTFERPVRWGLADVVLGGVFVLSVSMLAGIVGLLVALASSDSADPGDAPDVQIEALLATPAVLAIGLVSQQLAQAGWPWIVSRWKGRGLARDFGVTFRWSDLWIGPVCGLFLLVAASATGDIAARLVGLEHAGEASNTGIVTAGGASAWSIVLYLCIVVGAPISEELFFRGLVLRSVAKRFRSNRAAAIGGVAVSTLLFTAVHIQSTTPDGLTVLLSSIGVVGLILGVMAVRFDRLGPSIGAHATLNLVAVVAVLSTAG